jgi:hypothetical protein
MVMSLNLVFLICASVCFLLAAINTRTEKFNLTALGLFFWSLSWFAHFWTKGVG